MKTGGLKCIAAIPSVDLPGHITTEDLILLGSSDRRYRKLERANPVLRKYLNSFRTQFNKKVKPSIVVRDENHTKIDSRELAAFRNAIAVSGVLYSRVKSYLCNNNPQGFYCTDLFDFSPVSISSDGTDLFVGTTYEMSAWNDVKKFSGQVSPSVVYLEQVRPMFDNELMLSLLNLIEIQPANDNDKLFRDRIVRSLEMAYYALRSPSVNLKGKADFGVQISIWVSAFEILANPHVAKIAFSDVSSLIKNVQWEDRCLLQNRYDPIVGPFTKPLKKRTTLTVQIYGRLYHTRNMYLHGNPIPEGQFEYDRHSHWGNLFFQTPALYRCVVMQMLKSRGIKPSQKVCDEQETYERVILARK